MKPVSYKRIFAYLIDIFLITIVASLLTYFIPVSEEYQTKNEEFIELVEKYSNGDITKEEYLEKGNEISYVLNKESVATTVVTTVLSIVYFVVIAYYMNGQTVGKKLMKLKIVSNDDSRLTMNNYLIRAFIIDSLLMNVISILMLLLMNKNLYLNTYDIVSTIFGAIYIVSFGMILFRVDGRGLHDLLAKTKVVSINDELKDEVVNEKEIANKNDKKSVIQDAEIIEK